MAEADSEARNAMEDEDLEDGEIETDEEIEEVKPAPAAPIKSPVHEPAKKSKSSDDDLKKTSDAKGKNDHRKSTPDNSAAKSKKVSASDTIAKGKSFLFLFFVVIKQILLSCNFC